jgi:hypothetical protein
MDEIDLDSVFIHDDLVEPSLDKPSAQMFQLLTSLHQEITTSRGELDGNAFAGVASPDVQTRIARPAVDGEEIEVCMESGENSRGFVVLDEVGGGWGE